MQTCCDMSYKGILFFFLAVLVDFDDKSRVWELGNESSYVAGSVCGGVLKTSQRVIQHWRAHFQPVRMSHNTPRSVEVVLSRKCPRLLGRNWFRKKHAESPTWLLKFRFLRSLWFWPNFGQLCGYVRVFLYKKIKAPFWVVYELWRNFAKTWNLKNGFLPLCVPGRASKSTIWLCFTAIL